MSISFLNNPFEECRIYRILTIGGNTIVRTIKSLITCVDMIGASRCPKSILWVANHLLKNICGVSMIFLNIFKLLLIAWCERLTLKTLNPKNVWDAPSIIEGLDSENGSLDMFEQILSKHTFFRLVSKLWNAFRRWRVGIGIGNLQQVLETSSIEIGMVGECWSV